MEEIENSVPAESLEALLKYQNSILEHSAKTLTTIKNILGWWFFIFMLGLVLYILF